MYPDPGAFGDQPTGEDLGGGAHQGEGDRRGENRGERGQVDSQREGEEEDRREEIAKWTDHRGGTVLCRTRDGHPDEKRSDSSRDIDTLHESAHQKHRPENRQQHHLVGDGIGAPVQHVAHRLCPTAEQHENREHHRERNAHVAEPLGHR